MPVPENVTPLSVSHLTNVIKLRLEEHFAQVWLAGEVSNFVRASSGHLYFSLKDDKATIRCAMWRGSAFRLKFDPRNGMEIIVRGSVTVFPPRGDYQFIVEELIPKGIGAADLALRQLKEKLLQKGYFDPKRKRPLPRFPKRVALIASPTGAAIRDMLEILTKRWPLAEVIVRPSRVQGEGAAPELTAAIRELDQLSQAGKLPLDAIVLGRGGGSAEDLSAFNEEMVADAIVQSSVPVIAAIGHEVDVSIADLVADYRALTPSQAITALCPDRSEVMDEMIVFRDRLREAMIHRVEVARQRVDRYADRPAFRRPLDRIRDWDQRVDDLAGRLGRASQRHRERCQQTLESIADRLASLSPLNVLARGYSLTQGQDSGQMIRDAAQVSPGEVLITRVAKGSIVSRVERTEE